MAVVRAVDLPQYDLAVLVVSATKEIKDKVVALEFETKYPAPNSPVVALGFGLGMRTMSVSSGSFSGVQDGRFQHNAPINPGNSGGPLINQSGKVIGINSSGVLAAQQVGFAQPACFYLNIEQAMLSDRENWKDASAVIRVGDLGLMYHRSLPEAREFAGGAAPFGGVVVYHVHKGSSFKNVIEPGALLKAINVGGTWYDIDTLGDVRLTGVSQPVSILHCIYHRNPIDGEVRLRYENPASSSSRPEETDPTLLAPPARNSLLWQPHFPYDPKIYVQVFGCTVVPLTIAHLATEVGAKLILPMTPSEFDMSQLFVSHIIPKSTVGIQRAIQVGNIITAINGTRVTSAAEFRDAIRRTPPDGRVTMQTKRGPSVPMPWDRFLREEQAMTNEYEGYNSVVSVVSDH